MPQDAWMDIHMPEAAEEKPGSEGRKEQGRLVGETAKGLFGPYEGVTTLKGDGSLDIGAMPERTEECPVLKPSYGHGRSSPSNDARPPASRRRDTRETS